MSQLVRSISMDNLLNQREAIISHMIEARATLKKVERICGAQDINLCHIIATSYDYNSHQILREDTPRDDYMRDFTQRLDAQLWQRLMHESGLRTFMDTKARNEWDETIHKKETPPLTLENIEATFERLYNARGEMFERGVIEVFRGLSWDYKSNLPQKFGKRIIVPCFMDSYGHISSYSRADKLADLERVMYMFDGKPAPDHRTGIVQLCGSIQRKRLDRATPSSERPSRIAEDDYFRVKWFKNQNGHFYFKRADLVDKMNKIISKHYPNALPPEI